MLARRAMMGAAGNLGPKVPVSFVVTNGLASVANPNVNPMTFTANCGTSGNALVCLFWIGPAITSATIKGLPCSVVQIDDGTESNIAILFVSGIGTGGGAQAVVVNFVSPPNTLAYYVGVEVVGGKGEYVQGYENASTGMVHDISLAGVVVGKGEGFYGFNWFASIVQDTVWTNATRQFEYTPHTSVQLTGAFQTSVFSGTVTAHQPDSNFAMIVGVRLR